MVKKVITDFNSLKVAAPDCLSPLVGGGGGGGGGTGGEPPITAKLAWPPMPRPPPPTALPQKCWFCNFHVVFCHFAQTVLPPTCWPHLGNLELWTWTFIHIKEPELSDILACLLNICLKEFCFPDSWTVSLMVLVFYNVWERSTTKNYCPVSVRKFLKTL